MNDSMNELVIGQIEDRLIECGIHRILICLEKLNDEQVLFRPNINSNSINNQILHLDGNVRQWLVSSLTDEQDFRNRDEEFDPENYNTKEELIQMLHDLEKEVRKTFPYLKNIDLSKKKHVQCYHEPILSIIIHVIEHFSYHLGQITYITKMLLDIDTGYYAGMDLTKVNKVNKDHL